VLALLAVRAVAAVAVVLLAAVGDAVAVPLAVLALTTLALINRDPYAIDGSDQMTLLVALALTVGDVLGARSAAVSFVGAAAAASYFVAGSAKLAGGEWRSGEAVPLILGTTDYGSPSLAARLWQLPALGRAMTWSSMGFEILFPLALVAPAPVLVAFLAAGLLFHIGTAVTMGLNVFPWAFAATYPCVVYLWHQI
jgi:hypothetical protein